MSDRPPSGPEWLHEIKFDGYRVIARKDGARVRLWARTTSDYTAAFTRIRDAVAALPVDSAVLDGEAIVLRPDNSSDFEALRSPGARRGDPGREVDGQDMRPEPLEERRKRLAKLLSQRNKAMRDMRVWARSMKDYSKAFSRIRDALAALPVDSAALDRKAIVLRPDNTSDFEALRSREGQAEAILAAYELMEANGQDVRPEPLEERRKRLARLLSRNTKAVSEVRPAGLVTPRQPTVPFQTSFRPSRRLR